MDFYLRWSRNINTKNEFLFIDSFMNKTYESIEPLLYGKRDDVILACRVLLATPIKKFISSVKHEALCFAKDIVQYSNFDKAVDELLRICEAEEKGLTFNQIGKFLMSSETSVACKKYGENHSKLAYELSLVQIKRKKVSEVSITALGRLFIITDDGNKYEIIKRLAIRNPFIKNLILAAKSGIVYYDDMVQHILSETTALRRKANVKYLTELILKNDYIKNNIFW